MDRRFWRERRLTLLLVVATVGGLAASPSAWAAGGSAAPVVPLTAENWEARTQLQQTLFAPVGEAAARRPVIVSQEQGAAQVSFQVQSAGGAVFFVFANQEGKTFPLVGTGTFIIKRSLKDGALLQAKVFVQDDEGSFLRLFPQGDRSTMDIFLYGEPYQAGVELPLPLDRLLTSPLERIVSLTRGSVDWSLVFPPSQQEGDVRISDIVRALRPRLPKLRDRDDGAMDVSGRLVLISTGKPDPKGGGGFNCSGFAKWVVDGFYHPLAERNIDIETLRAQSQEERGGRWTGPFEEERDPFFGLDWTRNLARDLAEARDGTMPDVTDLDVRDATRFAYVKDAGYPVGQLRPLLYFLARRAPGTIYLGSVNAAGPAPLVAPAPAGAPGSAPVGAPIMRQHHHVVVLFPYFDAQGVFRLVVMERNVETSSESLARRYPGELVHLVRLDSTGTFVPPSIE